VDSMAGLWSRHMATPAMSFDKLVRSGEDDEAQGHLCRNPPLAQANRKRSRRPLQGQRVGMGRNWQRLGSPIVCVMILASLATGTGAVPFTGCHAKLAARLRGGGGAGPGGGGLIGGCLPFRDLIRKVFSRKPEADDGEIPLTGGGQPRRVVRVMHSQSTPAMRELLELNLPPLAGPAAPAAKAHGRKAEKPGLIIKGDNLKPEVMNSYENRHAALQWNADGTFAQGVVPLQYSSSHTSSSEDSTSSSSTSSQTEEKPPAQLRRNTRRVIRGDRLAEHVRERCAHKYHTWAAHSTKFDRHKHVRGCACAANSGCGVMTLIARAGGRRRASRRMCRFRPSMTMRRTRSSSRRWQGGGGTRACTGGDFFTPSTGE
jgi:hypothetical protein